jgi:hypothetical protein
VIDDPAPVWEIGPRTDNDTIHDAMEQTVCDLLCAADAKERMERRQNPELRQFRSQSGARSAKREGTPAAEPKAKSGRGQVEGRSGQRPVPLCSGEDSSDAASKALDRCFSERKS